MVEDFDFQVLGERERRRRQRAVGSGGF